MVELPQVGIDAIQLLIDLVESCIHFATQACDFRPHLMNIIAAEQKSAENCQQWNSNHNYIMHDVDLSRSITLTPVGASVSLCKSSRRQPKQFS